MTGGKTTPTIPALLLGALLTLAGCGMKSSPDGFANYPGFENYFAAHPVDDALPDAAQAALLVRYRPILHLPPGHAGPIDFYRDYLPNTRMVNLVTGEQLALSPKREALLARINQSSAALELLLEPDRTHPAVYGRMRREIVSFPSDGGDVSVPLTFLTYTVPFAHSGLPARLGRGQELVIRLAETLLGWDRNDWHQLDVYTAYTLVLGPDKTPFAVLLAQHNHHRAYLVGKDLAWPEDDRIRLDVAVSSNELYLSSDSAEVVAHRTIPFSGYLDYLLSGKNPPLTNGWDITHGPNAGGKPADYRLNFLPASDPFYRFKGWLGAYRPFMGRYVGRSGSPGADYYTMPELLPLGNTLKFAYLQDGDAEDIRMVRTHIDGWEVDTDTLMEYGGRTLWADHLALDNGTAPDDVAPLD